MGISRVTVRCLDGTVLHANYQDTADALYLPLFRTRAEADAHKQAVREGGEVWHLRVSPDDESLEPATCHIDYGGGMDFRVLICRRRMCFLPSDIDRCPKCAQFCFTGPAEHWSDGVWDCPEPFDIFELDGTP